MQCAVFGASGYAGAELLRVLARHPNISVAFVGGKGSVGRAVGDLYEAAPPDVASLPYLDIDDLIQKIETERVPLVFLALPHGESQNLVPKLMEVTDHIVDLAADFRIKDPELYKLWYGEEHSCPTLLKSAVYGMPELSRDGIAGAKLVAVPGCYPTAATLAMKPLVNRGFVGKRVVVDAASGVSGAGRSLKPEYLAMSVEEDFRAYGLLGHRHTVEMEHNLDLSVLFTPHLAPMKRGILATCYLEPTQSFLDETSDLSQQEVQDLLYELYQDHYSSDHFVRCSTRPPGTSSVYGTNNVALYATFDRRTRRFVALGALDNLTKGAAGQAVQCANIVLGYDEDEGLKEMGVWP